MVYHAMIYITPINNMHDYTYYSSWGISELVDRILELEAIIKELRETK